MKLLGLPTGIEPATFRLQGGRTTYCATRASQDGDFDTELNRLISSE